MSNTTIGNNSGSVSAGSISGMSVTSNSGSITANGAGVINYLKVGTNSGSITAKQDQSKNSGALNGIKIGSLTPTGIVSAVNATNVTITTLAGSVQVANMLTNLSAGTIAGTANLSANQLGILTATAQSASSTVKLTEAGVTRTMSVTSPNGGALPASYSFYYDGSGSGDPNVSLLINPGGAQGLNYNVSLLTDTVNQAGSGFDLGGIYSVGQAHVQNIVVSGSLQPTAVSQAALAFFKLPKSTPGGVQLPQDTVAVAAGGNLPAASIVAKAVPALAAGSFAGVPAATATAANALAILAKGTSLTQANGTFGVFISAPGAVAQFLVTTPGGPFDAKPMLFADQANGNSPVTVTDTLVRPSGSTSTQVSTVVFQGQGGSLTTAQPVNSSITSNGWLGDLFLSAPQGLTANVTAPSILGNINVTGGGISGIIQTSGDLGHVLTKSNGTITGVTSIQVSGGFSGQIIAGGNLISTVGISGGMNGVIAAQGDIGAVQTSSQGKAVTVNNSLTRYGGISVSGGFNGQLVALGNVFGDISIDGGLNGQIAVKGNNTEIMAYGLSSGRDGILGNVSINGGIRNTGTIASAGMIGDKAGGTHLSINGNDKGIIAAEGSINYSGDITKLGNVFQNTMPNDVNAMAIDYIFTSGGVLLNVTIPNQLNQILQDLLALTVNKQGNLSGTTR
jgi:hypothetical protein